METHARYVSVGIFTVIAAAAGFLFVYWLHSTGGAGRQTVYRIRFETPVIGLRTGVSVLFNGLRVGEVQRVQFDPKNAKLLEALIAVDPATPVREDTHVGVDAQGLMGSATVSLTGGTSAAPLKAAAAGEPPLLVADPDATESLTQAARVALKKLDALLGENAQGVRDAIANIDTFSQVLARNSGRVDNILAGLEKMTGTNQPKAPPQTYDLAVPTFPPSEKPITTQIAVREATALVVFDTQRILVSTAPDERQPLEQGQWSDSLPKLVQAKIAETLEAVGFQGIARVTDGFTPEMQVLLDIRSFEVSLSPSPVAHVAIAAKILNADGKIVGARTFEASAPASGADASAAFPALSEAFGKVASDLALWARDTI
jgi:phospholipid/cholesterol/gamma-HCH transport system substrate-binding protein